MSERWCIEIKINGKWEVRHSAITRESLLDQLDLYAGRALARGYEGRIIPYIADESRAEMLEAGKEIKV